MKGFMKHPAILIIIMLIFSSSSCQAQEHTSNDSLFSLDLSYALTGLLNQGWGIGASYEKKLLNYFSVKAIFGHMTFLTGIKDVYNTSVSLSLFLYYYPLSDNLDKLYIGAGNGCDFMNYFGDGELPETTKDTLIHITPQVGWRFHVLAFLMINVSAGYKFIISESQNYAEIKEYMNTGFHAGLGFKILFKGNKND